MHTKKGYRHMNSIKYFVLVILISGLNLLFPSCIQDKDYSSITYRNYLEYEITRSTALLETTVEGTAEGEYRNRAKNSYQNAISEASLVCNNIQSDQSEIDLAYSQLIKAGELFYDMMIPYRSVFESLINYADFTLNYTTEGTLEGNAKPGSKAVFQAVIDDSKNILNRADLTQRMVEVDGAALLAALYTYDGNIVGRANLFVDNFSFENPGFTTTDFSLVPAWQLYGKGESWAAKASIYEGGTDLLPIDSVPDGRFVSKIGSYTQGIYQVLKERFHPNVTYTLDFKASLLQNSADAYGKKHKVILLSRVIVFDKTPGDYRFVSIVNQSYDTVGILPGGFIELKKDIDIAGNSAYLEKNMVVDFLVRHSFDATKPIWAECYVALDEIKVYRKQK
jgi:hypothetical protein